MFCKSCGNEIDDNAAVCVRCGVATDNFHPKDTVGNGILAAGYALAALMPLIGGIVGIYVMVKGKAGHGIAMMVFAVFMFFFWMGFFEAY